MPKKTFELTARISTDNPRAIKLVLEEVLPKASGKTVEKFFDYVPKGTVSRGNGVP